MSLIDDFMVDCTRQVPTPAPDGEGGQTVTWANGETFRAAVTFDTSIQAEVAEKQGVTSRYTVTTDKDVTLAFHDVFRRDIDNKIFRVTSDGDDVRTPARASFSFAQVTAEEWVLT
jgi:hypothetical protein